MFVGPQGKSAKPLSKLGKGGDILHHGDVDGSSGACPVNYALSHL